MGRDPHRAPGRLAPLQPDYERGLPAQPAPERPPRKLSPQGPAAQAPKPVEPEDSAPYLDEDPPPVSPGYTPPPSPPAVQQASPPDAPWSPDDTHPRLRVPLPPPEPAAVPGALSIQERYQLLIHAISLYEGEWRLARIQTNAKNNWLQAYLLPRHCQLDLKEAISKDAALSITVDLRGNAAVKEPKKIGVVTRFKNWLWGA